MKRQMDDLLMLVDLLVDLHDDHLHDEHHDNYLDDHHHHLHKLKPFFMQVGYLGPFDHLTLEPSYVRI